MLLIVDGDVGIEEVGNANFGRRRGHEVNRSIGDQA